MKALRRSITYSQSEYYSPLIRLEIAGIHGFTFLSDQGEFVGEERLDDIDVVLFGFAR